MGDQFIDGLYNELLGAQRRDMTAAPHPDQERQFDTAKQRWWAEFIDVLGQKVGAWNEKGVAGGPVNFTKRPSGGVYLYHPNAEAELRLEADQVMAIARFGNAAPTEGPVIQIQDLGGGRLAATSEGKHLESPTAAAEEVIRPILVQAFRQG